MRWMLLRCSMSVRLVVGRKFPTTFHERSRSLSILTRDEDSRHQFKRGETSADNIAAELKRCSPTAAVALPCTSLAAVCSNTG